MTMAAIRISMQAKRRWNGPVVLASVQRDIGARMGRMEAYTNQVYRRAVGTPYPPASRPGEFPHRRTGRLQRGLRVNLNRTRSGWQLTLSHKERHAAFLEHGTRKMAPRPHLAPTFDLVDARVRQLLNVR